MNSYPVYPQLTDYNSVSTQCTLLTIGVPGRRRRHHVNLADLSYKDQLYWHCKQFCYKTSSHGIPMLGRAPNNFYRIVWLILLCCCCVMFLYQSSNVVERYSRYDKITDIHLNFDTAPFPAITICSLNPYLDSLLKDVEAIKKIAYSKCECVKSAYDEDRLECTADKTSIPASENDGKNREGAKGVDSKMKCLCAFDRGPATLTTSGMSRSVGFVINIVSALSNLGKDIPWLIAHVCVNPLTLFVLAFPRQYYGYFEKQIIETLGFQNMSDEVAIVTKAKENLIFAMSELSEKQRIALSIPKKQLIQKCSFNGKACDIERDFKIMADPTFGNCYTFNFDRNKTKAVFELALRMDFAFQSM